MALGLLRAADAQWIAVLAIEYYIADRTHGSLSTC